MLELVIEKYCDVKISDYYEGKEANRKWIVRKLKETELYDRMNNYIIKKLDGV